MNFINFVAWLTAGAVIGWFASRMVEVEKQAGTVCLSKSTSL